MREWWTKCPQRKKQMKFWLHISQLHNSYALDTNHTLVFEFSSLESKQCSHFFPLCPIFDLSSWKSQLKEKEYDWCSTLGFSSSENEKKTPLDLSNRFFFFGRCECSAALMLDQDICFPAHCFHQQTNC